METKASRVWFGVASKGAPRVLVLDYVSRSFYFSNKGLVKEFFPFNDVRDAQILPEQQCVLRIFIRRLDSNYVDVSCQSQDTTLEVQRLLRELICDKQYEELFEQEVQLEGTLDKKGKVKWAPRHCTLVRQKLGKGTGKRRAVFTVFKNKSLVPVNIVEIDVPEFSISGEEHPGHQTFRIGSAFRSFELRAPSSAERNKWIAAMIPFSSAPEGVPIVPVDTMPATLHKYPVHYVELHAILMDPSVDLKTYYDHHDRARVSTVLLQRMEALVERRARAVSSVRLPSNMEEGDVNPNDLQANQLMTRSQLDLGSLLVQVERRSGDPRVSGQHASSVKEAQKQFNGETWTRNWSQALDNIAGKIDSPRGQRRSSIRIIATTQSPKARSGVTLGTRGAAAPAPSGLRTPSAFGRMVARLQTPESSTKEEDAELRNDISLLTRGALFTFNNSPKKAKKEREDIPSYAMFVDAADSCLVYCKADALPPLSELSSWKGRKGYEFVDLSDISDVSSAGGCRFTVAHSGATLLVTAEAPGMAKAWQASLSRMVSLAKAADASDAPQITFSSC